MGYAWIDEVQQSIDGMGVVNYLNDLGFYGAWASYESCLCQVNLEGVEVGEEVVATIAAQGVLTNRGYQAFLIYVDSFFNAWDLSGNILSIEDGFLSFGLDADACNILLNAECAFLLTSDNPAKITSLQVVRIEPAGAVLTFDMGTPSVKLATPTGLYADNITSDSARVSWTAVENASGYKVEYRRQGDTTWNE